eukprot:TRINITY_DN100615_c0_g1_i1.p1 TRINITY_DN100615_c0_g1~~TRINITY_DN100615_c0_g1_i1.p1  ORF type:complete len:200 (+),score=32.22 TRINITY_DN100615_c0_g1_i1:239-838(+)
MADAPKMKLKGLRSFCGLPVGTSVLVAGFEVIFRAAVVLSIISSRAELLVAGTNLSPTMQVVLGAFGLLGVPLCILAAFGAMWRMIFWIQLFYQYLAATVILDLWYASKILVFGDVCSAVADDFVMRRGPVFVCILVGLTCFFWTAVYMTFKIYLVLAVWSVHYRAAHPDQIDDNERVMLLPYSGGKQAPRDPDAVILT